jgi:hypothetical protein
MCLINGHGNEPFAAHDAMYYVLDLFTWECGQLQELSGIFDSLLGPSFTSSLPVT